MIRLEDEAFVERHLEAAIDRLDAERDSEGSVGENRLHHLSRGVHEVGGWHHLVDETNPIRFGGIDHLAGEEQLDGAPLSDESGKALAAPESRKKPELALGLAELRRIGCDTDVTRHRQLAPSAQRETVYNGDHRLGTGLDSSEHILTTASASFGENRSLAR